MSVKVNLGVTIGLLLFSLVSHGQSNDGCKETEMLIDRLASAKIRYEEAVYFKDKKIHEYRTGYSSLVKEFKRIDKIAFRRKCLLRLSRQNELSPSVKGTYFTYKPLISSTSGSCDYLSRYDLLRVMLANLDDLHNDSSLLCHPELLK